MERPEQVEKQTKAEQSESSVRFSEEATAKPRPINVEKESQKIADLYDFNKTHDYEHYTERVVKATERLSCDLQRLAGGDNYDKLLMGVFKKIPDEPVSNPRLEFTTKDGDLTDGVKGSVVSVVAGDGFQAYRIVQPGDSFNQIAKDTWHRFVDNAGGEKSFMSYEDYRKSLVELNPKVTDLNHIQVGQAIRLRENFTWS